MRAFAILSKSHADAKLVLVGGGGELDTVKKLVETLKIEDKVLFLTEKRNVEDYYALFDVFALPSRFEGLPLVAIEAQATGIPCLLSDCITREADITGHVQYLPITSASVWAVALSAALETERGTTALRRLRKAATISLPNRKNCLITIRK